nr:hypothetical protein Iba_chr04aCG23920 [Ipomoea batatas]
MRRGKRPSRPEPLHRSPSQPEVPHCRAGLRRRPHQPEAIANHRCTLLERDRRNSPSSGYNQRRGVRMNEGTIAQDRCCCHLRSNRIVDAAKSIHREAAYRSSVVVERSKNVDRKKNDRDRKLKVAGRRLKEAPPSGRTKVTAATPAVFRRHSAPPSLCRREDAAEPTGLVQPPPRLTAAADDRRKTE